MIAQLECLPCLLRQAREMAVITSPDADVQKSILREVLAFLSVTDLDRSPPEIMQGIGGVVEALTGVVDPYSEIKDVHTSVALRLLPRMQEMVLESVDPFLTGMRLAIAGNIIDLGARVSVSEEEILSTLDEAMELPLHGMDPGLLRSRAEGADSILYLADNAGETVFDRVFIGQLPPGRTTVAVRGGPALNDATMREALHAGLDSVAVLVDNGSGAPATVLEDCSGEFVRTFRQADLVIAKGQGNYESLSSCGSGVHFLFRVKCRLVAHHSGFPLGSLALVGPDGTG